MSSCVIRKDDPAAFQPWEPTSFDAATEGVTAADSANVTLPTIEQIAAIEEQARQEGFDAGHAEGHAQGLAEGREQAAREAARLHDIAEAFSSEVSRADELISQQVLELSLDLTRALLKSALAIQPELVLPIVREAVRYLPTLQQPALLYLNPADTALVSQNMGDELAKLGWTLTDDAQLEPGGCRVDSAHNQIDASLPTRWQRLTAALGKDSDWLAA